jgi:hypothetical protein
VAVVICYAAVTLLLYAPLVGRFHDAVPADPGDPILNTWILWWNARQAPWSVAFWHAPAFAPAPYAFALSESLLGLSAFATPLQWLGASPLQAYNAVFVLTPILNGVAAYGLCRLVTGRRDASFVGGLYFMMAPYRASQLSHVQTLATFYMPLALLGLHAFVQTGRRRWLALLLAATVANGLVSGYHLVYFAVVLGLALAWMVAARHWRATAAVAATLGAALLALLPVLLSYRRVHQLWDLRRGLGEMSVFSADVTSFIAGAPALLWHPFPTLFAKPEADVYPGFAGLVAILLGGLIWVRECGTANVASPAWIRDLRLTLVIVAATAALTAIVAAWRGPLAFEVGPIRISVASLHKPVGAALNAMVVWAALSPRLWASARRGSLVGFYGAIFVAATILMLGPEGQVMGHPFWYKAPFAWLVELPGFDAVRVPARLATIQIMAGAALMALGLAYVSARVGRRSSTLLVLAGSAVVLTEGWVRLPVVTAPAFLPVSPQADLVVELPTRGWTEDVAAMYRGIAHARPVVNGYSGYVPPHYPFLAADLLSGCLESLEALRRGRSLDVVVHTDDRDGPRRLDDVRRQWPQAQETTSGRVVVRHVPANAERAATAYDEPIDLRGYCSASRVGTPGSP